MSSPTSASGPPRAASPPMHNSSSSCDVRLSPSSNSTKDRSESHPSHSSSSGCNVQPLPPSPKSRKDRSLAFKLWARGRCFRCLARDHQVSSCQDSFRCIRCLRPGHKERHCSFQAPTASPCFGSPSQHNHIQNAQRWADVVAASPPNGHHDPQSVATNHHPRCAACGCLCRTAHSSSTLDLQSLFGPLMESLRLDLQKFFISQLEEVVRPFRSETSTIKLWLARIANHLERGGPPSGDHFFADLDGLFGPCSPVRQSSTPLFSATNPITDELELQTVLNPDSMEVVTRTIDAEICQKTPLEQTTEGPLVTLSSSLPSLVEDCMHVDSLCEDTCVINADSTNGEMTLEKAVVVPSTASLLQNVTPVEGIVLVEDTFDDEENIEDIILVEDASDDEEDISQVTIQDPIFLITIEDQSMDSMIDVKEAFTTEDQSLHSMTEVNGEVPKLIEDPSANATSSSMATTMEENDLTCPPLHPPSPLATLARRRRKSYDRSSLRRSGRIAQRNVLKDLGVVGKDGKLNEGAMQDIVVCLKELLPPDLLKPLMSLKGRAFWDFVAEASLLLR